jgi:hypothetical protein
MKQTNSEDLVVWQRAADLVPKMYRLLRAFLKEKTYALRDQIRRATVSVPASIAVGQARQHPKEFLQLLSVAKGAPNLRLSMSPPSPDRDVSRNALPGSPASSRGPRIFGADRRGPVLHELALRQNRRSNRG